MLSLVYVSEQYAQLNVCIGREKPILEMDLKLDDLLEKQSNQSPEAVLDLEYVQLSGESLTFAVILRRFKSDLNIYYSFHVVAKTLKLINRTFLKR